MSRRKNNFYVVKVGRNAGIYTSWEDCQTQISGYSGAVHKGFKTKEEAERYFNSDLAESSSGKEQADIDAAFYIDGSYDQEANVYGYGVVVVRSDKIIQEFLGANNNYDVSRLRNVAGEMLGAMAAVTYAERQGYKSIVLCYDYSGVEMWAIKAWRASNPYTLAYANFMEKAAKKFNISFKKIAAHKSDKYNERADMLAKQAVSNFIRDILK